MRHKHLDTTAKVERASYSILATVVINVSLDSRPVTLELVLSFSNFWEWIEVELCFVTLTTLGWTNDPIYGVEYAQIVLLGPVKMEEGFVFRGGGVGEILTKQIRATSPLVPRVTCNKEPINKEHAGDVSVSWRSGKMALKLFVFLILFCVLAGLASGCTTSDDCWGSQLCCSGICRSSCSTCYSNSDCSSGEKCCSSTGKCLSTWNSCSSCSSKSDCSYGERCCSGSGKCLSTSSSCSSCSSSRPM